MSVEQPQPHVQELASSKVEQETVGDTESAVLQIEQALSTLRAALAQAQSENQRLTRELLEAQKRIPLLEEQAIQGVRQQLDAIRPESAQSIDSGATASFEQAGKLPETKSTIEAARSQLEVLRRFSAEIPSLVPYLETIQVLIDFATEPGDTLNLSDPVTQSKITRYVFGRFGPTRFLDMAEDHPALRDALLDYCRLQPELQLQIAGALKRNYNAQKVKINEQVTIFDPASHAEMPSTGRVPTNNPKLHNIIERVYVPGLVVNGRVLHPARVTRYIYSAPEAPRQSKY